MATIYDEIKLTKRLHQEQYILDGMRPSSKLYQQQYQLVKQLKEDLEWISAKNNQPKSS